MPRQPRLSVLTALLALLVACAADSEPAATSTENLSGRWTYIEAGETAELELRQEPGSGNVTGTLALFGKTAPIEGKVENATLLIRSVGGVAASRRERDNRGTVARRRPDAHHRAARLGSSGPAAGAQD